MSNKKKKKKAFFSTGFWKSNRNHSVFLPSAGYWEIFIQLFSRDRIMHH